MQQSIRYIAILVVILLLPWQTMADDAKYPTADSHSSDDPFAYGASGPVSKSVYSGHKSPWKMMDPEGKGYVTKEAWLKHAAATFDEADTKHDGKLTREEYSGSDNFWAALDPEGKGYVTKKDWVKVSEGRFNEIDDNNDGKITVEEMQHYHEKMRIQFTGTMPVYQGEGKPIVREPVNIDMEDDAK